MGGHRNIRESEVGLAKTFLKLTNGIPSHDTFGRVFAAISPEEFEKSFMEWVQAINELTQGQVIAIFWRSKKTRRTYMKISMIYLRMTNNTILKVHPIVMPKQSPKIMVVLKFANAGQYPTLTG